MNTFPRVQEIIAAAFEIEADVVTPEADLVRDLGAKSVDLVELDMALEEAFGLGLPLDRTSYQTVQDIVQYLETNAR